MHYLICWMTDKISFILIITLNCKLKLSLRVATDDKRLCAFKNIVFSLPLIFRQQMIYKCSYSHDRGGLTVIWKSICFPLWSIQFCWYDEEAIMSLKLSSSVITPGDVLRNRPPLKFNMQPLLICVLWGCSSKSYTEDMMYKMHVELKGLFDKAALQM